MYDINDPRKVIIRKAREEKIAGWLKLIREGPATVKRLNAMAHKLSRAASSKERADGELLLNEAREKQGNIERARAAIQRYLAIPRDADRPCRCSKPDLELPPQLAKQVIEV